MSQKYICNNCGCVFDEDTAGESTEYEGEGVMRGPIHYMACPECGCDDEYTEAEECELCGKVYDRDEMIFTGDEWACRKCAESFATAYVMKWGITDELQAANDAREMRLKKIRALWR